MASSTNSNQNALLDAVYKYWQGFSSSDESEAAILRRWSDQTLARGMVERAMTLLDVCAMSENGRLIATSDVYQEDGVLRIAGHREWNGLRLSILGLNTTDGILTAIFQSVVRNMAKDSLALCILPSSYLDSWQDFASEARARGRFILPIFPTDMNALARGRWTLFELAEYKLYRLIILDKPDVEAQYSELSVSRFREQKAKGRDKIFRPLSDVLEKLDERPADWVEHPLLTRIASDIQTGQHCLLAGPSSSGKSVLAFEVGLRLISQGSNVVFVDMGAISSSRISDAWKHLEKLTRPTQDTVLIVDDMQSNPIASKYLLKLVELFNITGSNTHITILGVTWPGFVQVAVNIVPRWLRFGVRAEDVRRTIQARYGYNITASDVVSMSSVAGDDLLLWRLLLESGKANKHALANEAWERKTQKYQGPADPLKRVILIASLLGRYEFDLTEGFLIYQAGVSKSVISSIVRARILRRTMGKLVLGHRSLCALLADWLVDDKEIWSYLRENGKPDEPIEIVNAYIRFADREGVWTILKTLHAQVGFKGQADINEKVQLLIDVWKGVDSLIERIEQQQRVDPSWGNSLSSTLFSVEALCAVGKNVEAASSIDFMRTQWFVENDQIKIEGNTTERGDFDKIQDNMREQDRIESSTFYKESAGEIDLALFHRTWALGLILCSEYAFQEYSNDKLQQLAMLVEKLQHNDGYFYPARVPWSTARVVMGLARCGRTYTNSHAVKAACDWLLRPVGDGGVYHDGHWESGTGQWNTAFEVTSMCIIALVSAGISPGDSRVASALEYVITKKHEWTKPGREIDTANAIMAYLAVVGSWQDIVPEIRSLLGWSREEVFWDSATKTASELLDQSCKVAVIADYLIEAVWSNLRNDLPEFLEAFAVPWVRSGTEANEITDTSHVGHSLELDRVKERYSQLIQHELDNCTGRITDQLRELRNFEENLRHKRLGGQANIEEKRSQLNGLIEFIETQHQDVIQLVKSARNETDVQSTYRRWQNIIKE